MENTDGLQLMYPSGGTGGAGVTGGEPPGAVGRRGDRRRASRGRGEQG